MLFLNLYGRQSALAHEGRRYVQPSRTKRDRTPYARRQRRFNDSGGASNVADKYRFSILTSDELTDLPSMYLKSNHTPYRGNSIMLPIPHVVTSLAPRSLAALIPIEPGRRVTVTRSFNLDRGSRKSESETTFTYLIH
ncbi:hypothetical protein EVAR_9100_1 [Eumeta japonica]|uniref:Uncharacterized protein n=1 Tax=Eumeta variegata TaxID=151549 RepID=A0A4C1TW79_EUMVA|nr:hypothetical protein EVAR_9100_1 [Eumeta japonica]